jgi:hypothetical protein
MWQGMPQEANHALLLQPLNLALGPNMHIITRFKEDDIVVAHLELSQNVIVFLKMLSKLLYPTAQVVYRCVAPMWLGYLHIYCEICPEVWPCM